MAARSRPPITNPSARRACVTFRAVTNGFRPAWGADLYTIIRLVIEIARRRSIGAYEAIRLTLADALFTAKPAWGEQLESFFAAASAFRQK